MFKMMHSSNRVFLACAALLFSQCCLAEVVPATRVSLQAPFTNRQDVEMFLIGFGEGFDSDFGNITLCAKDYGITLDDFEEAYLDIGHGIEHMELDRIERGLKEFGMGLKEVVRMMRGCGFIALAKDLEEIAREISEGVFGISEMIIKEAVNIIWHEHDLTSWFHDASRAYKAHNLKMCGFYSGKIVGLFVKD